MNKYINIIKSRDTQISPFYSGADDELGDLKTFLIRLTRLWFSGEHNKRKLIVLLILNTVIFGVVK